MARLPNSSGGVTESSALREGVRVRSHILGNKPRISIAEIIGNSSPHALLGQLRARNPVHSRDALAYTDRCLFGARERKDKIVGTIAEPRKGILLQALLRTL